MLRLLGTLGWTLMLVTLVVGEVGPVLARALHVEEHRCVCPMDADGFCRCADCIRLDVHRDRDARRSHGEERAHLGPLWTTGCGTGTGAPALAVLPPVVPWAPLAPVPSVKPDRRALPDGALTPDDPDLPRVDRPPSVA